LNHDAKAVVGMLRDHLAAHDRPISFLFGAGTSSSVNAAPLAAPGIPRPFAPLIPAVAGLTIACEASVRGLGAPQGAAWNKLRQECIDLSLPENIESILTRIRAKLDALAATDTLCGLSRPQWEAVDEAIRKRIAELATPNPASIPADLPHHAFAKWTRNTTRRCPVEIFTTNYDVLFETSFDELRVPHFDGFIGSQYAYYSPETVENDDLLPSTSWVRLWKLHGSVSWTIEKVRAERRITRGKPDGRGEMILPSHRKYDESRKQPYRSLMDRLIRLLARQDSLLVSCGFSFGDQHINAAVLDAVEQHPRTHVCILMYSTLSETDQVAVWAGKWPNILVIGPNAGVISGRYGEWSVPGTPDTQLEAATGNLIQIDGTASQGFRLCAGDFGRFCGFLGHIDNGGRG